MEGRPQDELGELLRLAASDLGRRREFYRLLLSSTVYVSAGQAASGEARLEAGSPVSLQHWKKRDGTSVIPFFSSLEALKSAIDHEESYLQLPARSLFQMTLGATLVLNPRTPYGKELLPEEVRDLLAGELDRGPAEANIPKNTRVSLGQPAEYPTRMVDALRQLLPRHPNVKRAFLALIHVTSSSEKPHLIIGIEADGDVERALAEVGGVARDTAPTGPVDLYRVTAGDIMSDYFIRETTPFYERR
jgi:hypothetical protein